MTLRTALSEADFQALGALGQGKLGRLSPLSATVSSTPSPLLNRDLADSQGQPHTHIIPALDALIHPGISIGLSLLGERGITDAVIFYAAHGDGQAALTHADGALWLYHPAPVRELAGGLAGQLLDTPPDAPDFDLSFSTVEALVFWALLDSLRTSGANRSLIPLADILALADRPFDGLQSLAAYYRDCVRLPLPDALALKAACESLAQRGLLLLRSKGCEPGDLLFRIAAGLRPIRLAGLTQGNAEQAKGEILHYRAWILQGDTGLGLMWFALDDTVHIFSRNKDQLIAAVGELLQNPRRMFAG